MKKLLIVDGNSILNRAYYGVHANLTTADGIPTNAVYGYTSILKKNMDSLCPDEIVCVFDMRAPTFRHLLYRGYKATRKKMAEELACQLPLAIEVSEALGCRVVTDPGYEADDLIGSFCASAEKKGDVQSYVLTGDRDSLQLVSERTTVLLARTKEETVYTPESFTEEFGVPPRRLIDVKGLMGDSSDNIPGVAGVGEKTAWKMVNTAGPLETIYRGMDTLGVSASVTGKLSAGQQSAFFSRELADICRDIPSAKFGLKANYDPARLNELFTRLDFHTLRARFNLEDRQEQKEENGLDAQPFVPFAAGMRLPDGESVCAAYREDGGALLCGEMRVSFAKEQLSEMLMLLDGRGVVCHDYKKLCAALPRGERVQCELDTMLAAYLLDPGSGVYPLEKLALRYLQRKITAPLSLETEAELVSLLAPVLREKLEATSMLELLYNVEQPLAEVLAEMEAAGFHLDAAGLHEYVGSLRASADVIAARIYHEAGYEFNLNSPKQLGEVLFERLGLPAGKRTKTGYATDADTLAKLRPFHPIVGDILDYRQLVKLVGTYGENLIALRGEDGKIHSRFNQTGTATGRLSSADPNMQNIPVRGQIGRELRRYFTASDEDHILLDADYSQIELRLLAAISGDENMCGAFLHGGDIHRSTAAQVFGVAPEDVTPELRLRAKAVNFGIIYGIGDYSLSQDLGISRREAAAYIRGYLDTYPDVERYLKETVENARRDGYAVTMFGRRRYIPELSSRNANLRAFGERVAMNSPIQGTAADIIKIAMIRTRNALRDAGIDARIILQVHDELIVESSRADADRAAEILRSEMEHAASLRVPLTAEVTRGDTWFDAKQ